MNHPAPCLFCDDCLETMSKMDAEIVDAVVTDPPYGLAFMGKHWDHGLPGADFWREALRLAKPGAHLLAFGGTRTFHRLACAIEDAGWEIRDCLSWLYGSGFPKSLDVSKAIDREAGAERPVIARTGQRCGVFAHSGTGTPQNIKDYEATITSPATDAARQWEGWGTALKPAWEPIIMARKPLIGTVAQNVQRYGTGGLNVDGCRIGTTVETWPASRSPMMRRIAGKDKGDTEQTGNAPPGRWPANLVLDEQAAAMLDEQSGYSSSSVAKESAAFSRGMYGDRDTTSGLSGANDSGGASRFFYCAKASRSEREEGIDGDGVTGAQAVDRKEGTAGLQSPRAGAGRTAGHVRNHHPTVKPVSLMRWLVRLVCPAGGTVLDPFMGSGTTGIAAHLEGCKFIGIEKEREYFDIACDRIDEHSRQGALFA